MAPAAMAWCRSPIAAHCSVTSVTTLLAASSAGAISDFSSLSAPTAATNVPGATRSRNGARDDAFEPRHGVEEIRVDLRGEVASGDGRLDVKRAAGRVHPGDRGLRQLAAPEQGEGALHRGDAVVEIEQRRHVAAAQKQQVT